MQLLQLLLLLLLNERSPACCVSALSTSTMHTRFERAEGQDKERAFVEQQRLRGTSEEYGY